MPAIPDKSAGGSSKKRKLEDDEVQPSPARAKKQKQSAAPQPNGIKPDQPSTPVKDGKPKDSARRQSNASGTKVSVDDASKRSDKKSHKKHKRSKRSRPSNTQDKVDEDGTVTKVKKKKHRAGSGKKREAERLEAAQKRKAERKSKKQSEVKEGLKKEKKHKAKKAVSKTGDSKAVKTTWSLSPPSAGRFLDIDPIFVQDENGQECIIASNEREVQLLSLESSLVVKSYPASQNRSIKCIAPVLEDEGIVRIAYEDGVIDTWDWSEQGLAKPNHKLPTTPTSMASVRYPESNSSSVVYLRNNEDTLINSICLEGPSRIFYETGSRLETIQVLGDMEYIVATGASAIVIGVRKQGEHDRPEFVWTEIPQAISITCAHARLLPVEPAPKKKQQQQKRPGLSLAIGYEDGQIHLYDDIPSIAGQEKPQLPARSILHWHREAVSSVKFSQDGNYLISGGKETTLVLWQLQTAKKQFLPHLTSTIERIAVNPRGDRYALQLGDNSIMVLSTSELKPVANFAGLQMSTGNRASTTAPTAAVTHPQHPDQLLLSVPSTQPRSFEDISTRPFLQTFDLPTSRHIARQALTRNNVTDFNLGPEKTPIIPPDVERMAISHDGSWLATVDVWTPPAFDLAHLLSEYPNMETLRQSRREVYLKFWRWDEKENLWTLTTRVDSPHASPDKNSMGSGKVLALISDPASNAFVSVGEDACVKIWKPKQRKRNGVPIKDRTDTEMMEFTCKRTIQLPQTQAKERVDSPFTLPTRRQSMTACAAYASDGSMFAVCLFSSSTEEAPVVYFINHSTGATIPKQGLAASAVVEIGFLDQYFIAVSKPAAYVWDLVNDSLMYKVKLVKDEGEPIGNYMPPLLAVDQAGGSFGVCVRKAGTKEGRWWKTKVQVQDPRNPGAVYESKLERGMEGLLAGSVGRGYTILFDDATICSLTPSTALTRPIPTRDAPPTSDIPTTVDAAPEEAERPELFQAVEGGVREPGDEMDVEDDRPVVRPEQLASIFDTPQSFALPPVREMFEAVVGLFGRKPYSKPRAGV